MSLPHTLTTLFHQKFNCPPAHLARAPGRVNLLGEHVDYNGGFVLPAAIDRATYVAFGLADTPHTTVWAADFNEQTTFAPETLATKTDVAGAPLAEWARYPAGVLWALREKGLETPPLNIVFASEVPRGSGLSSSASVEMAFAIAWQTAGGWAMPPMERALLGQHAENKYVGVNCGIMDQFASACGEQDKLLYLDCRALTWRTIALPPQVAIVVADTSVRRKLTSGEYNQRRAACETAVAIFQRTLPAVQSLRDVSVADFERLASTLPAQVEQRARHVVEEIERTQRAIALLEAGAVAAFGALMKACHTSLRDLYEVSCPELDAMVRVAQALPGCYGARLTGAGFGGCTVNLVARAQAEDFAQALARGYTEATGLNPAIYICRASAGAGLIGA